MPSLAVVRCVCGDCVGETEVEENTSKAFVESAGLMAAAMASANETGSPLFLINLCASMAPVQLANKTLPGLENYRLYQVTRVEDGRTRYRLRLGFFTTEVEAEGVLARVRENYPTAFTACLAEEDRRHTRGYVVAAATKPTMTVVASNPNPAKAPAPNALASTPASAPAAPVQPPKAAPVAKATAAASPAPSKSAPIKTAPIPTPPAQEIKVTAPAAPTTPAQRAAAPKVAAGTSPEAKSAPSKTQISSPVSAPKAATPKSAPDIITADDLAGLENLSWDLPPLKAEATGKHAGTIVSASFKTQPVIKADPKPATPAPKPIAKADNSPSMRAPALELTLSDPPPPPPPAKASAPSTQPFHVGKGIELPSIELSLQSESANAGKTGTTTSAKPAPTAARPILSAPPAAKASPAVAKPQAPLKTQPTAPMPQMAKTSNIATNPDLDSTQTIRALTNEEMADEAQEKWFAIQLASSEQPVNLDAMPHLDIFEAYRLYSVAIAGSGKIVHSLRLGFFKEAVSAEAVSGYLKTFFGSPSVLRISVAEQARFKDATLPKKGAHPEPASTPNVVSLNTARNTRAAAVPTVTMEVVPGAQADTSATGSFRMNNTGSFRTSDTAKHRALTPTGMKPAAKHAAPAVKRSPPIPKKTSTTGKYKVASKKSLAEQLLDEAKEVELSESGIFKVGKNDSLLSRLVDKLKK
jgi:hypothetical protein